jgi:acetolactate synthase-1/2/3 large subunit
MPYDDDLPEMVYGTPRPVDADLIARASAVLTGAERPIVWAGGGVAATESQAAVGELVDAIGAIAVTTYAGRGILADHPGTLRVPAHEPLAQQLFSDADALVVLGSGFDAMNTRGWGLSIPERVIVIDASPASGAVANLPTVSVVIEYSPTAAADLAAHLVAAQGFSRSGGTSDWQGRAAAVSEQVRLELRENPKTTRAEAFLTAIETGWPTDGSLVVDMCVPGYWVGGYARAPRPRRMAYPVGWGTLGFGLPAAIGPAAHGNPTLAVCGDGGAAFALGELGTFVQERLPITLLIVDDGGYGMLRFDQQVFGHEIRGVDLVAPDWAQLAKAYSIAHVEVPDGPGLSAALRVAYQANLRGEPRMIVLHDRFYPPRTTSPRWSE